MRLYDHPASANCLKARLALAQLGYDYERVHVDIFDRERPGQLSRNPTKLVPVLEIEDGEFLAESGAILLYLAEGTPLLPEPGLARARVHQWLFFEQNQIEPGLAVARFMALRGLVNDNPQIYANRLSQGRRALSALARGLADGGPFIAGEQYSVADIALYAYVHCAGEAGVDPREDAVIAGWLDRVEATADFVNDLEPMPEPKKRR
ncbi:glutathione S-transferase family protein [Solirubrobacter phytolaccae]|uniref:Glutathione S-transferase family protein n=1 Tax=Solirubrobacter phytolaccae TaxID=1404360 RepID=A0A9X3N305_9ACTN|nr:glutathione S-transferase family protein [Solirubrobacter phytolaccae]MDA0178664.1 glutathione S-transferase family protein [Solirubrobacter phytolaccae]